MLLKVQRPAEVNLKEYNKIAIGTINGQNNQHANDVADEITAAMFDSKRFEVLDRQNISKIISEQKLGFTGLLDENSAPELGKIVGTAAMVFGRIQSDEYKEKTSKKDWVEKKKVGKKGHKRTVRTNHTTYYRDGVYHLAVNVKLIDMETARMLAVKTLNSKYKKSTQETDAYAPEIDPDVLYRHCLNDIKTQYSKLIAPYEVTVEASFESDDALPELDRALTQFKIGEWEEGIGILKTCAKKKGLKPKTRAKAIYNLGLAKMYGGECEEAIKLLKKAISLNPDSKRYQKAFVRAKKEKKNADKLKEQTS